MQAREVIVRSRFEIERALARRREIRVELTPITEGPHAGLWALEIDTRDPRTDTHEWIAKVEGDASEVADALLDYAEIVRKWG